jgi:hypothetical protein
MPRAFLFRVRPFYLGWLVVVKLSPLFLLAALAGCVSDKSAANIQKVAPASTTAAPASPESSAVRAEQIRTDCINGRRLICGRVLQISPDGLVVDSGYTDLLREPLTQSWVVPGNVSVSRNPNILELNAPETPCIGLVFLTDIPKRQKAKIFDYVVIMGYPAGSYVYSPAANVEKTIREFSGGLDTAVRLNLQMSK